MRPSGTSVRVCRPCRRASWSTSWTVPAAKKIKRLILSTRTDAGGGGGYEGGGGGACGSSVGALGGAGGGADGGEHIPQYILHLMRTLLFGLLHLSALLMHHSRDLKFTQASWGGDGGGIAGGGAGGVMSLQTAQKALHSFRVRSLLWHVSPEATLLWHQSTDFSLAHGGGGGNGMLVEGGNGGVGFGGTIGGAGGVVHRPQDSRHLSLTFLLLTHLCCIPESSMLRQKKSDSVSSHGGGLRGGSAGGEGGEGGGGRGARVGGNGGAM